MLVRRTTRARIAILGNGLPLRENPLRIAEEIAMLDVASGGRIVTGNGCGPGLYLRRRVGRLVSVPAAVAAATGSAGRIRSLRAGDPAVLPQSRKRQAGARRFWTAPQMIG